MAKSAKLTVFKLADAGDVMRTITCHLNGVTFNRSRAFEAFDTFCATEKSVGPVDGSLEVTGRWAGDVAPDDVEEVLDDLMDDDEAHAWEYYPQGETTGKRKYTGNALLVDFTVSATVPGVVEVSGTLEVDGNVTRTFVGS